MTVIIFDDFLDQIILVAKLPVEDDAPRWAKYVDEMDLKQNNGWMFVGRFINDGTVEVPLLATSQAILAASSVFDPKKKSGYLRHFAVVLLLSNGTLHPTDIRTDDKRGGWALRIRDQVITLLSEINAAPKRNTGKFSAIEI